MGQEGGEKWTAAADLQPTLPKSDRLPVRRPGTDHAQDALPLRRAAAWFWPAVPLAALLLLAGCTSQSPEQMLASARTSLAKRETGAALILIKNALQKNPDLPEARFLLGKTLFEAGDFTAAELELRKALEMRHSADEVLPLLVRAYLALGQYNKVVDEVPRARVISAEARAALNVSLAGAYTALGDRVKAGEAVATALSNSPGHHDALIMRSRIKAAAGDFVGALADAQAVVARVPDHWEGLKLTGDLLAALDQTDVAATAYRKAIEVRPDLVLPYGSLIALFLRAGKIDDASAQFALMKKAAPNSPLTDFNDTLLSYVKRDYKAAREKSQLLLKKVASNAQVYQIAGAIEYNLGSYVQAEDYLVKSLAIAPASNSGRRWLVLTHLASGQPAKALAVLTPALASIEGDSAMLALAGDVYMQLGDARKGEEFFLRATRLDPKDAGKRTSLAMARFVKGEVQTAQLELTQISAEDAGTVADMALLATSMGRRDFDKALQATNALAKKRPNDPQMLVLHGDVLQAKGDAKGARKSFEGAMVLRAGFYPAAARLAGLDVIEGNAQAAEKRFQEVLASDAGNYQALLALAKIRASAGAAADEVVGLLTKAVNAAPTVVEPRVALVRYYLFVNDARRAATAAQEGVTAIPDSADLLDALGRAQMASGEVNQALATYARMAAALPNSPFPHMLMADVHIANKDLAGAAQSLRKALSIKPDLIAAQRGLVAIDLSRDRPQDALAAARDIQKQRPDDPIGYILQGDIGVARNKLDDAIGAYQSGLKRLPASSELATRLYRVLVTAGKLREAERHADEWMGRQPRDTAFRFLVADAANARGDHAAAMVIYKRLHATYPDNPPLLNNMAMAAAQLKQADALEYAEKAVKLAPNEPAFMDTLGVMLSEKGESARALELLNKATKGAPQVPMIRLNYARALIRAERKSEARKELEELAKLGDRFSGQPEVAKLLKAL